MSHLRVVEEPAAVWSRADATVRAAEEVLLGLPDKSEDETCWWIRSRSPANDHCYCTATSRTFFCPPVALPHRSAVWRWHQSLLVDAGGHAPPPSSPFGNTTETHTHPPTVIVHHQLFPHRHFETRKEGSCGQYHHNYKKNYTIWKYK